MPRTIISPPDLSGAPLAELKQWLAIATAREDALLARLLAAAHETCERFTGLMPLECTVEERLDPRAGWLTLATRPVRAITAVSWWEPDAAAAPLDAAAWNQAIAADGSAQLDLAVPAGEGQFIVRLTAGLAAGWATLPPALAEGIIRLAAHGYRSRDMGDAGDPPAAVAALWRPWRRLRL